MNIIKKKIKIRGFQLVSGRQLFPIAALGWKPDSLFAVLIHREAEHVIPREIIAQSLHNQIQVNLIYRFYDKSSRLLLQQPLGLSGRMPFFMQRSTVNSEYEWYLQRSMVKDIFDIYHQFVKIIKKRKNINSLFQDADSKEREIYHKELEYAGTTMMKKFVQYIYPTLISRNEHRMAVNQNTPPDFYQAQGGYKDSQIQIEKKVDIRPPSVHQAEGYPAVYQNTLQEVNVEKVMEQVFQNIDEQLRYERLKKGLLWH